jgi:cell division protein FtsQ
VVLTVLAAVILLGAGWALLGSSVLVVRHVQVAGDHRVTGAQVRAAAGIRPGTPLARLDGAGIAARVERLAWVQSARVSRSWPDGVTITVQERVPALAVADGAQFEVVDIGGVVLWTSAARPARLPLLRSAPAQLRGSAVVRAAVMVMDDLPAAVRGRVGAVTATAADAITLHLRGGATVRWGGTGRAAAKARELQALLRTHASYYDVSSPEVAVTSG